MMLLFNLIIKQGSIFLLVAVTTLLYYQYYAVYVFAHPTEQTVLSIPSYNNPEVHTNISNCKLKLYAWYFPSFYPIKENSDSLNWTEWTLVKNAPSTNIYGHKVMKPVNNDYYDLRDINTRIKHRHLAQKYGIDGFALYHYWFENHPVLNEVVDMLLIDSEPNIEFHLMFVNLNWERTVYGVERAVSLNVSYDTPEKHAIYLLPFFLLPQYTRIDDKPVFIIYKPKLLPIDYIDKLTAAVRKYSNGIINELYIVACIQVDTDRITEYDSRASSMLLFAPWIKDKYISPQNFAKIPPLTRTNEAKANNTDYFGGILTGWDPTPRYPHGNHTNDYKKVVDYDFHDVDAFEKYVEGYIKGWVNESNNTRHWFYVFAWNEWGEGAVLEPNDVTAEEKGLIVRRVRDKLCESVDAFH